MLKKAGYKNRVLQEPDTVSDRILVTYGIGIRTKSDNLEIRKEWANAVAVMSDHEITDRIIRASKELLASTLKGDEAAVAGALPIPAG